MIITVFCLIETAMRTTMYLSKHALHSNITQLLKLCGTTLLAPVLKSNAYGHGMLEIARILDHDARLPFFCVAHDTEALTLHAQGIKKPLLTLACYQEYITELIKASIHMTIFSVEQWQEVARHARALRMIAYVHLKVDTGMSRLGLTPHQVHALMAQTQNEIKIVGISTHLNDKDAHDLSYTHRQLHQFQTLITQLKYQGITHALSSGALDLASHYPLSMARVGTHLYGFWSSSQTRERAQKLIPDIALQPIATWKSSLLQIKMIPRGTSVGYGRTFIAPHDMTIAIIPIGYWDGYPRALSNKGFMRIRQHHVPVIGIVSMNLIALDVSAVHDIAYHDQVIIYDQHELSSVEHAASLTGSINIELTTRINPSISRVIVD